MKTMAKETALAVCGGCLYVILELLWRGRSHWTMFILGGVCFVLIGAINEVIPWEMPFWNSYPVNFCMKLIKSIRKEN